MYICARIENLFRLNPFSNSKKEKTMNFILKNTLKTFCLLSLFSVVSCSDDDNAGPNIEVPATYSFTRDGQPTVSFSGQTTRLLMAEELASGLLDFSKTEATLLEMYANETAAGEDANPFSTTTLNESTKSIRSKVAASNDLFSANTADATAIKNTLGGYISLQATDVFSAQNVLASPGVPGQIADGNSTRYVNEFGIEYNQFVVKGLIGALVADQMLNNYLSPAVLDAGTNVADNDAGTVADGKSYTNMEHKWDEAYGYIYGTAADLTNPNATIGEDDSFLNKYTGRVSSDDDFMSIAADIYDAFKLGRAAIVVGDYEERNEQAGIIRKNISTIIGVRAVYYLQAGKSALAVNNQGTAFHDLSEGLGFIFSLQFTRQPNSDAAYFTKAEVDGFLNDLVDGPAGLWDVTPAILDAVSDAIAAKFDFTVEQAL
ncbi:MAG: hypothetical protein ACI9XO_002890 [Paraglaciecola sp.]